MSFLVAFRFTFLQIPLMIVTFEKKIFSSFYIRLTFGRVFETLMLSFNDGRFFLQDFDYEHAAFFYKILRIYFFVIISFYYIYNCNLYTSIIYIFIIFKYFFDKIKMYILC